MKTRKLRDIEVSAIGMGCMGFTHAYGKAPEEKEAIRLVHQAFELGCSFFDTAEMYSFFKNEEFVGKALKELPRDQVVISDKFWPQPLPGQAMPEGKLSEAGIRQSIEGALKRLQTDYIDIYTEHQMEDGSEEQVAYVMGQLIKEGKIRGWGQSSPSAEQIRKAHAVTPITAIQSEYSMMERKWEKDVLTLCRELGIGFVAFSPMGNGFLSGKYTPSDKFQGDDVRRVITRFSPENMEANKPLLDLVHRYAEQKGCTAAQMLLKHTADGATYKAISIRFERRFLRGFFSSLDKSTLPADVKRIREAAVVMPQSPALQSLFLSLLPYTDANVKPSDEIIQLKMQEAVWCLLDADARFYPTLFDFNELWKIDLLPFMEANYTQDMTLEEFATYTGRSLATFKRDFAKVSDLSPEKWLIKKRLDKAYEMLRNGKHKPSDVYYEVGFKNRSHFAVAFKRQFGVSPGRVVASM